MQESVSRLKQLLLDEEHREVERLKSEVERLSKLAVTRESMQKDVADVLDGAIVAIEKGPDEAKRKALTSALATVAAPVARDEIKQSTDEIAEALNPHVGAMVKAYVARAFNEMMVKINRRLESGFSPRRWKLKFRSWRTGKSERELLFMDLDRLQIQELYLIRRGSGELIRYWETGGEELAGEAGDAEDGAVAREALGSNREASVSAVLTGIENIIKETFDPNATLKSLQLEGFPILLRQSPNYLLVAKCTGKPDPRSEAALEEEFLAILEKYREPLAAKPNGVQRPELRSLLPTLASRIDDRLGKLVEEEDAASGSPRLAWGLLGLIALCVLAWVAWSQLQDLWTEGARQKALAAIEEAGMGGYPIEVEVARGGGSLRLKGLAPASEKDRIVANVRAAVRLAEVHDKLETLPEGFSRSAIARLTASVEAGRVETARAALERARARMERMSADLVRIEGETQDPVGRAIAARIRARIEPAAARLDAVARLLSGGRPGEEIAAIVAKLAELSRDLAAAHADLAELRGEKAEARPAPATTRAGGSEATGLAARTVGVQREAEQLAGAVESLAADVAATERQVLLRIIAGLNARLESLDLQRKLTARQELAEWARAHAVFFAEDTRFRDEAQAARALDGIAALIARANASVRIVGYTDEIGTPQRNASLALDRAERVRQGLVQRGVAPERLVVLGRANGPNLSASRGPGSPNRRVEFEVGFNDEVVGSN